jgi:PTS system fructose-specific IIC component
MTAQIQNSTLLAPDPSSAPTSSAANASVAAPAALRRWLMTGVGYMIPFVVTGGALIAAAYLVGGADVAARVGGTEPTGAPLAALVDPAALLDRAGYAGLLYAVGTATMFLAVPVLAAALASAMAGPLALVAGAVGGLLTTVSGAGYLGSLLAGLLAGAVVLLLRRVPVPPMLVGLFAVVLAPLLSTLVVTVGVLAVIAPPAAALERAMTNALTGLSSSHAVLLGLALGLMVAVDIGGPINKTAYSFALSALAGADGSAVDGQAMAAVMAAGMTPPLAMALASAVRPRLFSEELRTAGKAGWLLGASFVTEGAIPFAAADPVRVIPALMAGSAVAGGLSMTAGATTLAPHGGVWVLGLVDGPLAYLAAVALGVLTSAVCVVAARSSRGDSARG